MGGLLHDSELQNTIDFCVKLFAETSAELGANGKDFGLDAVVPAASVTDLEEVLYVQNSTPSINNLESEPFIGYTCRLERGRLGLVKV